MKNPIFSRAFSTVALLALALTAQAQTGYITGNSSINYATPEDIVVGYGSQEDLDNRTNGTSPQVSILAGGSIGGSLSVFNHSQVTMSDGSAVHNIGAADTSTIIVNGGQIDADLFAMNTSQITMSGGSVAQGLTALEHSTVRMSGGSVGYLFATGGVIHYTGGSVNDVLYSTGSGHLHLYGNNLSSVLTNPNAFGGASSLYTLSGTLRDGTLLDGKSLYLQNNSNARFTLHNVPAPSALLTLLMGGLPLGRLALRSRRK